jgi:hypothetical protein
LILWKTPLPNGEGRYPRGFISANQIAIFHRDGLPEPILAGFHQHGKFFGHLVEIQPETGERLFIMLDDIGERAGVFSEKAVGGNNARLHIRFGFRKIRCLFHGFS